VVVHLIVDCRDAMGANAVNTMAESLANLHVFPANKEHYASCCEKCSAVEDF